MSTIHYPAQRPAPVSAAAPTLAAAVADERGWAELVRTSTARAALAMTGCLVVWSLLPALMGWTPRVILSGSMEPRVHVGDVIVTREVPAASLAKGQVVTVTDPDHPDRTRTHRLVRRGDDGTLVTKGDANQVADSSHITADDVLGVGVLRIPFVGRPAFWLAQRNWAALAITFLVLGWCLVSAFPGTRKPDGEDDSEDQDDENDDDRSAPSVVRSGPVGSRTRARVVTVVAASVVAAGLTGGSASAAFLDLAANSTSTLKAATSFYPYKDAVVADSPYLYWRLDQSSGTAVVDSSSPTRPGTLAGTGYTWGQAGALVSEAKDTSLGLTAARINVNTSAAAPATFSVEAWFRSTSTAGGRILGMGNATGTTSSTTIDRQLYLAPNGKVMFGIGTAKTTIASTSAENDGAWHHVVGTYVSGTNGMKLYVDGVLQGSATATAQSFTGYWRAGAELMSGWTGNPTSTFFVGDIEELAVYTTALSATRVQAHTRAGITPP